MKTLINKSYMGAKAIHEPILVFILEVLITKTPHIRRYRYMGAIGNNGPIHLMF